MKNPSAKALSLILEYEVGGGQSYYEKYLSGPTWPGGASGMTLAIGIDCGYYTPNELQQIFSFLPSDQLKAVQAASGKTGQAGKEYTHSVKNLNIKITWQQAIEIFDKYTWPKFARLAERTFTGLDGLCDNAYGAIVSLVFNRGSSLVGDSRREMREIKDLVAKKDYRSIALEFQKMKRVWKGRGLDGLLVRRDAEAALVLSCVN
jgi:GH24 family phage-related lysozyme (muramidase)